MYLVHKMWQTLNGQHILELEEAISFHTSDEPGQQDTSNLP